MLCRLPTSSASQATTRFPSASIATAGRARRPLRLIHRDLRGSRIAIGVEGPQEDVLVRLLTVVLPDDDEAAVGRDGDVGVVLKAGREDVYLELNGLRSAVRGKRPGGDAEVVLYNLGLPGDPKIAAAIDTDRGAAG